MYVDGHNTILENQTQGPFYANTVYDQTYNQPIKIPGYQDLPARQQKLPRTNYVTSDGYVSNLNNLN